LDQAEDDDKDEKVSELFEESTSISPQDQG